MVSKENKVGRPLLFKTAEELEKKVNAYFDDESNKPYTVSGLAVWLECDRRTLVNYGEKEEFFPTIKKAKTRIEASIEQNALMGIYNPTFSIFNMKNNFGWKEKQEIDTTSTNRVTIINDLPSDADENK